MAFSTDIYHFYYKTFVLSGLNDMVMTW